MVLGKLDSHMQKKESGPFPYTIHKDRLKMDERPKCEIGIIKILEENTGSNLFLDTSPKAREARAKMSC